MPVFGSSSVAEAFMRKKQKVVSGTEIFVYM
jgi:hypothetical protein